MGSQILELLLVCQLKFLYSQLASIIAPRMGEALGTKIFTVLVLGPIMIWTKHDILTKFLKNKTK